MNSDFFGIGWAFPASESCEVSINRLKMELKSKVERTRRLEKNPYFDFARIVCFNKMLNGFTESWVSRLSRSLPRHPSLRSNSIGWYPRN